jgi:hypothetical protein
MWTVDPTPCRGFEDRELKLSKNIDNRMSISRYVKSRCNLSRQIKVESEPLIPVNGEASGIGTLK